MQMHEGMDLLLESARKLRERYGIEPGDERINYVAEGLKPGEIARLIKEEGFKRVGKCYSEPGKLKIGAMKKGEENGTRVSYLLFSEPITEIQYRLLVEELESEN